jgi:hypothetical protein
MQGLGAVAIFLTVVFIWRTIYVKRGNIGFWQLAGNQPDAAFEWMENRSDWIVLRSDDPKIKQFKNDSDLVGPFKLYIPQLGGMTAIFARAATIDESQKEFIQNYGSSKERSSLPWLSTLTMLYPIGAQVWIANKGAPLLPTLGYGFANLGYLLLGAGILAGNFRALGFRYRIPTLIAAVAVWLVGTILSNL